MAAAQPLSPPRQAYTGCHQQAEALPTKLNAEFRGAQLINFGTFAPLQNFQGSLTLELAMARKAIVLALCCGAFFTASLACGAQTFGDIRAGKQTPNLTQPTEDPAIDKWMRTATGRRS